MIEDHLRPSGYIMLVHAGDRGAECPLPTTARTTIPSETTNNRNGTSAARQIPAAETARRVRARVASTAAPAAAAHAGLTPAADAATNPGSVQPTAASANTGVPGWPALAPGPATPGATRNRTRSGG